MVRAVGGDGKQFPCLAITPSEWFSFKWIETKSNQRELDANKCVTLVPTDIQSVRAMYTEQPL